MDVAMKYGQLIFNMRFNTIDLQVKVTNDLVGLFRP